MGDCLGGEPSAGYGMTMMGGYTRGTIHGEDYTQGDYTWGVRTMHGGWTIHGGTMHGE